MRSIIDDTHMSKEEKEEAQDHCLKATVKKENRCALTSAQTVHEKSTTVQQ